MTILTISKISSCLQQLDAAVDLWFSDAYPIAVHTLSAASGNVLRDLMKAKGVTNWESIRDKLVERAAPGHEKEVRSIIRKPENFFKHADNDPDDLLKYNSDIVDIEMLDSICCFEAVNKRISLKMQAFVTYLMVKRTNIFNIPKEVQGYFDSNRVDVLAVPKSEAYAMLCKVHSSHPHWDPQHTSA